MQSCKTFKTCMSRKRSQVLQTKGRIGGTLASSNGRDWEFEDGVCFYKGIIDDLSSNNKEDMVGSVGGLQKACYQKNYQRFCLISAWWGHVQGTS